MKDTIYREDAVKCVGWGDSVTEVINRIKSLPSAEIPTTDEKHQLSAETQTEAPTDLISRADAIEAVVCHIWHTPPETRRLFNCENYVRDVVEEALKALPSAEKPYYDEDDYWNGRQAETASDAYKRGFEDAKRAFEIELAREAEAVQGWRTGKPKDSGDYMVTLDAWGHRYIDVMHYAKPQIPNREVDGTCWYRDDEEWGDVVYDDKDILAWMPLPKPYKGGDDAEGHGRNE